MTAPAHTATHAGRALTAAQGIAARSAPPARLARPRPSHAEFLGLPFALASLDETVRLIVSQCEGPFAYVVTPNAQHVVAVHERGEELAAIYRSAWLSVCDSQVVRGLAALDGLSLPLVTGSDLVAALLAEQNGGPAGRGQLRLLVVGPDTATEALLRVRYPRARIEAMPAPARLAQRADLRLEVACTCMRRPWDVLLLCVGSPAQEMIAALIAARGHTSGVALCVGASIDFLIGRQTRAPRWLRRLGLEWAYRLMREPGRLWRRYLIESPRIVRIFLAERSTRRR